MKICIYIYICGGDPAICTYLQTETPTHFTAMHATSPTTPAEQRERASARMIGKFSVGGFPQLSVVDHIYKIANQVLIHRIILLLVIAHKSIIPLLKPTALYNSSLFPLHCSGKHSPSRWK